MASIIKRGKRYRVLIRMQNFPTICKSFTDRTTAETFAKETEAKMERGLCLDTTAAEKTTLHELLAIYSQKILPLKKAWILIGSESTPWTLQWVVTPYLDYNRTSYLHTETIDSDLFRLARFVENWVYYPVS
ncbi:MAG: hypothetical protein KZQ91_11610 [Candidatus Thiodiazotropha sp. (ex Lucinoma borealis)]|nr:hypothetical protein [Candidatus Thiodiazotropha sp. (ex Lucinoma borealis)]